MCILNFLILADRARDLSKYCDDLIKLPRYLSESGWVQDQLFGIHEGDIETDIDPGIGRRNESPILQVAETTSTGNKSTVKVKIIFKDEIFAIKIPSNSTFEVLKTKIIDRLGFNAQLQCKEPHGLVDLNHAIFESALRLGKLTVVAS